MIEVLKQLVEALEWCHGGEPVGTAEAIKAGKKLIAELEKHEVSQEPVQVTIKDFVKAVEGKEDMVGRPVYWAQWPNADTHPQPKRDWVGLTYQERCELWNIASKFSPDSVIMHDFAKDIEQALKDKNT
jgi:hypothetical protein